MFLTILLEAVQAYNILKDKGVIQLDILHVNTAVQLYTENCKWKFTL